MVMAPLPAIPEPKALVDLSAVQAIVAETEAWLPTTTPADVEVIHETIDRLSALQGYLRGRQGGAALGTEILRAKARLGELESQVDDGRDRGRARTGVERKQRSRRKVLADNPMVTEAVIAASSDADPPSERKVIKAVRTAAGRQGNETVAVDLSSAMLVLLDAWAAHRGVSRGAVIAKLLKRVTPPGDISPTGLALRQAYGEAFPAPVTPLTVGPNPDRPGRPAKKPPPGDEVELCAHAKKSVMAGGLVRCDGCGWMRGVDGRWRAS